MNFCELVWKDCIQDIASICTKYDELWIKRKRKINSQILLFLTLNLCSSKNQEGYSSLIESTWKKMGVSLSMGFKNPISASSFCDARKKLPTQIFKDINTLLITNFNSKNKKLWLGHRIFSIDASKINLPKELRRHGYKLPTPQAHYPQGLLSGLFNLKEQVAYDIELRAKMNERLCVPNHLNQLLEDDVMFMIEDILAMNFSWNTKKEI